MDRALVITKGKLAYYNNNVSLEMPSKVEDVGQKCTFTNKMTLKWLYQTPCLIFKLSEMGRAQDCGISKADTSMLPSIFDKNKVPPRK